MSCSSNVLLKCLNEDVPQSQTDPSESHGHTGSPNIVPTLWVLCHVPNLKDKFVMDQARILSKCQILACWGRGNLLWDMGSLAVLLCNPVHLSHPDPSSFLPNIQFTPLPGTSLPGWSCITHHLLKAGTTCPLWVRDVVVTVTWDSNSEVPPRSFW